MVNLLLAALALTVHAPAAVPEPCAAAPYRQFDFIIGKFDVYSRNRGKIANEHVDSEMNDCVLHEYFQSTNGERAESFTFYDPAEKAWFQYAVGLHLIFRVKGGLQGNMMLLEGTATHLRAANSRPFRISWTPHSGGTITELLSEQDATTHNWTVIFSGTLVPAKR